MTLSSRPTFFDLFAGAGLLSSSFVDVGFESQGAVEQCQIAASTYARNLGNHITVSDIRRIKPVTGYDVLVAGPPCQGFSTLGSRKIDDPRNKMAFEVSRWSKIAKPKVIVIENVPAFLEAPAWKQLARRLRRQGFRVDTLVLDAVDFGCPQRRKRSFTIAHRRSQAPLSPRRHWVGRTVRDAWVGLPSRPNGKNHHWSPEPSELALARMKLIPAGGDRRDVMEASAKLSPPSWYKLACQVTDAWGRMVWDQPSNTLRTALQNPSKGRYIHPSQNRVITLREAARLHSIRDSYQFAGLPTQVARQIGNGVPPALGRAVARLVLSLLG